MKKITVFAALVSVGLAAGAQSLNVSSAYEAWNRGYLKKAKGYIDEACQNEQTKVDGQTWFYSTMIYCSIGDEIAKNSKKGHELAELAPYWYTTAYNALMSWKQFDTKGEYTNKITPMFKYVGNQYYNMAAIAVGDQTNQQDYNKIMLWCDTAVTLANMVSDTGIAASANFLAGQCANVLNNTEAMKKYFLPLTKGKAKKSIDVKTVYETMFQMYVKDNDTVNAMKMARAYTRNYPEDYRADALLASAYLMNGNAAKGVEIMNKAIDKVAADPSKKAEALCIAAGLYENAKDYTGAEAKYKEAVTITPNAYAPNYGLASMNYNRAADKLGEAEKVPLDDQTGAYDKLANESKELFRASIPYFTTAINYIDALPDAQKPTMRAQLHSCLKALSTVYARLEMTTEAKAVLARIEEMESTNATTTGK
jgi:tetratricopeptide (TPR) repeat protein